MEKCTIKISTHNINGFSRNKDFLRSRCENESDTIHCLQEHWLRPPFKKTKGVNQFRHLHKDVDGYATSAMKKSISEKILTGRPYGGTGFLWNKKHSNCIKPRVEYVHERVTVLEIVDNHGPILCINAYFPYYDSSKIAEQRTIYIEVIGFIEHIMCNNPNSRYILAGDFNCNIFDYSHPFTSLVRDLMTRRSLVCSYDLDSNFDPQTAWSRTGRRKNGSSYTLLDYVMVSESLRNCVSNTEICHYPDNLSDHLPVTIDIELYLRNMDQKNSAYLPSNINWSRIDNDTKQQYANVMEEHLDSISVPFHSILHGSCACENDEHVFHIEKYFNDIVDAVKTAESYLPRSRPGVSKNYWNNELSNLKAASSDAFSVWKDVGKPSSGPIFELKKSTHYRYKLAINKAKKEFDLGHSNQIYENLLNGNSNRFWSSWQTLHGKQGDDSVRVNGKIDNGEIANEFASGFKRIYDDANTDQAKFLTNKFSARYRDFYNSHRADGLDDAYFSWQDMINIMSKLQPGKASGSFLNAEHIMHGSTSLVIHLHLLFNAIVQHGYVPYDFLKGVVTPIIKDSEGDVSSIENYRGITLSHVFSFLFEHGILLKIDSFLQSDDLQFGYKKKHSTNHAIYTVKKCINYFCTHGSSVYVSFLDCTKGFDRVSHDGLFLKLLERNVPLCWLRILIYWYSNMYSVCKWKDAFSDPFPVISGVRQGGVLSAKFWALYMDDLVHQLRSTYNGCYITELFIACVLYADDVCLMSPTRKAMQTLLDTCSTYANYWCIKYNENKSKMMYFGKDFDSYSCVPMTLNGGALEFVREIKYLGVIVTSDCNFSCSAKKPRSAFYRSSNSILNVIRCPSVEVQMKLLYSICIPNLTYACEVVSYNHRDMSSLHIAANDAIRKIFGYDRWESIRTLRQKRGYDSVTEIFANRKLNFEKHLSRIGNSLLTQLSNILIV